MLKYGTSTIGKLYLGSTAINKAYYGSSLVFQSGSGPEPDPYADWTDGYRITTGGTLVADSTATVSPFFAIPSGSIYLTFDLIDTQSYAPFMAIYDSSKNYLDYWGPGSGYRTVKVSSITGAAFLRFSMRLTDRGEEFVRVRDGSFNQQNLWTGTDYNTDYDNVIFGCYRTRNNNTPTEALANATTMIFDIVAETTSLSFGSGQIGTDVSYDLQIFNSNGVYADYWTQNANPRTVDSSKWGVNWPKVAKNFVASQAGSVFIKNNTTNTYLFKGKSVV